MNYRRSFDMHVYVPKLGYLDTWLFPGRFVSERVAGEQGQEKCDLFDAGVQSLDALFEHVH
ncbi:hypothetical protein KSC_055330 [Ktedonobacter sp. SOSP1-52]|nr:hypothetical protein KSC_055330 [Ktedonobacter sp. SOSP1-52]